jgi:hypothetical protein
VAVDWVANPYQTVKKVLVCFKLKNFHFNWTFYKNFYPQPHPNVVGRNPAEVDAWLMQNECSLNGQDVPAPIMDFKESTFPGKPSFLSSSISLNF